MMDKAERLKSGKAEGVRSAEVVEESWVSV
jgi:hypothetical protein